MNAPAATVHATLIRGKSDTYSLTRGRGWAKPEAGRIWYPNMTEWDMDIVERDVEWAREIVSRLGEQFSRPNLRQIVVSGDLGSGKSSVWTIVSQILEMEQLSTGDMMREMAAKQWISITEMNELAESDMSIDKELDDRQYQLGLSGRSFFLDARLGALFLPYAFKIYLQVSPAVGWIRVWHARRNT